MTKLNFILLAVLMIGVTACGNNSKTTVTTQVTGKENPILKKGKSVYRSNCTACHQKDGRGVQRVNPPLTNTEWVIGDKTRLINIVLDGFNEKIEVEGVKYNGTMMSFSYLSDEKIASVLTYVRQSFGNDASAISVDEVAAVRAKK